MVGRFIVAFVGVVLLLLLPRPARAEHPGFSVGPAPAWVKPERADAEAPLDGSVVAATQYLLFDAQTRHGAIDERYTHVATKITNEAGLANASQVQLSFDPSYQSLVVHSVAVRRGSETRDRLVASAFKLVQREPNLEAQMFDGRTSALLFLDDLRVGDIVEYAFTLRGSDPTEDGHFTENVVLGAPVPIHRLHARIITPRGDTMHLRAHAPDGETAHLAAAPISTSEGIEYEWNIEKVPGFEPEPGTPSWFTHAPYVQITDFGSWGDVATWATKVLTVTTPSHGALVDWATKTRASAQDEGAFILAATRFVQDEVRYVAIETGLSRRRPTAPETVFERRYGDCKDKATLLVALLRIGGVTAVPALVSTALGHILEELAPTDAAFDHVIVHATHRGKPLWIDATTALMGGGLERFRFSPLERALDVSPRTEALSALQPEPADAVNATVRDHLSLPPPDAKTKSEVRLDSRRTYRSSEADEMRARLRSLTDEQLSSYFAKLYEPIYPGIHQVAPIERADHRDQGEVTIDIHMSIPEFWKWNAERNLWVGTNYPPMMAGALVRPPATKRVGPVALAYPNAIDSGIDIELPFDIAPPANDTLVEDRVFALGYKASLAKRTLSYDFTYRVRAPFLEASELPGHLEKTRAAEKLLEREITFRAAVPDGVNWSGVLVLVVTLPLFAYLAFRAYRWGGPRGQRPAPVAYAPHLQGIGGWLVPLAIGIVCGPLVNLVGFIKTAKSMLSYSVWHLYTTPGTSHYAPGVALLVVGEALCLAALTAYSVTLAVLFFEKRRAFVFHFTIYAAALVAYSLLDHILVDSSYFKQATGGVGATPETLAAAVRGVLWAGIWTTYLRRSVRAAATFVVRAPRRGRKRGVRQRSDPPPPPPPPVRDWWEA